jgi:hypothetical protein
MPLTPLPEDNTKRYKMVYTVEEDTHSLTARAADSMSDSTANSHFVALFAAIGASLGSNCTWVDLQVAAKNSNVFNSTGTWTPSAGTGGPVSEVDQPRALCFPGRSNTGRKVKAFVYGVTSGFTTPDSYEEDPLVTATFQGFQGLLDSQSDFWLAIDGSKPVWYFRLTVKTNDHWVKGRR